MSGRTPTPWHDRPIEDGKALILGAPDGFCSDIVGTVHSPANARRIVAAVNGTANLSTEALEAGVVDKLVEALEQIERRLSQHPDDTAKDDRRDKQIARSIAAEALTLARGEQS